MKKGKIKPKKGNQKLRRNLIDTSGLDLKQLGIAMLGAALANIISQSNKPITIEFDDIDDIKREDK